MPGVEAAVAAAFGEVFALEPAETAADALSAAARA